MAAALRRRFSGSPKSADEGNEDEKGLEKSDSQNSLTRRFSFGGGGGDSPLRLDSNGSLLRDEEEDDLPSHHRANSSLRSLASDTDLEQTSHRGSFTPSASVSAAQLPAGDSEDALEEKEVDNAGTDGADGADAAGGSAARRAARIKRLNMMLETLEDNEAAHEGVGIIVVGVMRTGLKTLHRSLRNLGYSNIYDQEDIVSTYDLWDQVLRNRSTSEAFREIFKGSEVIMGMPTFCFWEQLVDLYPDARVILTVRDEDDWWESVRKAEVYMRNDLPGAPLRHGTVMRQLESYLMPSYHRFCEVLRFAWATTLGAHALVDESINESVARSSYRKHNSYVEFTLGGKTTSAGAPKLLVYNVKEGWEPLCKFLGRDIPEVDFPSVFNVPYFPGQQTTKDRCSFEGMMIPDSDFGMRMREELRSGLLKGAAIITIILGLLLGLASRWALGVPVPLIAGCYLVLIAAGWNVYVVISGLVTHVPALVVLPMAMKSFLIAGALQACLLSYGVLKEMLVTQDRIASPVLVLSSRFGAIACSAALLFWQERKVTLGAPLPAMLAFAFTNEASTWAGYEMLKYVSFPVTVMAKSTKMLPSMLMGRVLNGTKYTLFQYCQAFAAVLCVGFLQMSEDSADGGGKGGKGGPAAPEMSPSYKLGMGIAMLIMFFACDSFTSQWQDKLYKKYPQISQTQMMLGGNLLGFMLTSGTLLASWPKVKESMGVAAQNPVVLWRILLLGVVYALGQFCIYSAIRILGPLSFTWIMTARQLLSVLISLIFFGHGINFTKVICILVVFAIMSAKQLSKAMPKLTRRARKLTRRLRRNVGVEVPPVVSFAEQDHLISPKHAAGEKKDR